MMRVAFTTWKNRISPVFDTSDNLLIVEVNTKKEVKKIETTISEESIFLKIKKLKKHNIQKIICGAISRNMHEQLLSNNINVESFISGNVDEVITAWLEDNLKDPKFIMPGCCERRRNRFRNGRKKNTCENKTTESISSTTLDYCVCPKCGYKELHKKGIPCVYNECPHCGTALKKNVS